MLFLGKCMGDLGVSAMKFWVLVNWTIFEVKEDLVESTATRRNGSS